MQASKFLEFLFHIYALNTCSLHFRIQVSYGFNMLISLAEQEFKTKQPRQFGDSWGVTARNHEEPTKKITSRKDARNTKQKPIVSSAMIHVKFLGCFCCLPIALPSPAAFSRPLHQMPCHSILFHCVSARFTSINLLWISSVASLSQDSRIPLTQGLPIRLSYDDLDPLRR